MSREDLVAIKGIFIHIWVYIIHLRYDRMWVYLTLYSDTQSELTILSKLSKLIII